MSNADFSDFAGEKPRPIRAGWVGLIAPALAWGLALGLLAFAVPRFEVILKDFGIDLNGAMMLVIGASRFTLALVGLVVILLVADSIVRDSLARRKDGRGWSQAWSALMFGLPLTVIALLVVAIGSTMTGLLLKLSG